MSLSLERKIYRHPVTIKRYTALIVDRGDIAATLTIARQPSEEAYFQVNFENLVGTGTMTINGTSGGNPTNEPLTISNSKPVTTANKYTALTSITTSGLTGKIWILQQDANYEDIRQLKSTTSDYMFIDVRDVRDLEVLVVRHMGFEIITSHIGYCFQDTAITMNMWDEVIDYYGVTYQGINYQRQPYRDVQTKAIWEVALKRLGAEPYIS